MTKVLVTGASGFIAKRIVRELLDHGYEVRGSVRSERRRTEFEFSLRRPRVGVRHPRPHRRRRLGRGGPRAGVLVHTAWPFPVSQPRVR